MTLWSIVAAAQAALQGEQSFYACRALLGLLEVGPDTNPASGDRLTTDQGGFIPDLVLWLSYFYTSRELPIRLRYRSTLPW